MFLQVTDTISKDITFKALLLSIDQVTRYGNMYRDGVIQFKVSLLQIFNNKILLQAEEAPIQKKSAKPKSFCQNSMPAEKYKCLFSLAH